MASTSTLCKTSRKLNSKKPKLVHGNAEKPVRKRQLKRYTEKTEKRPWSREKAYKTAVFTSASARRRPCRWTPPSPASSRTLSRTPLRPPRVAPTPPRWSQACPRCWYRMCRRWKQCRPRLLKRRYECYKMLKCRYEIK